MVLVSLSCPFCGSTHVADVPTPWDIFFAVSPFPVLAYVVLSFLRSVHTGVLGGI